MGLPDHLSALLQPGVKLVETHISWLLLTGSLVYKLKRPVKLAFLDMRSLDRRKFLCEEEVRLNQRFAPELYLGVVEITATADGAKVGGAGEVIEYAVCMRQFDTADQLDRLLERDAVTGDELSAFGRQLGSIHAALPKVSAGESFGRAATVTAGILENVKQCLQLASRFGTRDDVRSLEPVFQQRLAALASLMDARREAGHVRECHGDLHSRNVARHGGRLVAFDCLEFEPAFRWIDVAEEIAFLYMDLCAQSRVPLAAAFLNGWLAQTGDFEACRLIRSYGANRAIVRAKVAALEPNAELHSTYLKTARGLLEEGRPQLVLMRGLSGSGKSWLASRLAPQLGAVLVRSDVERKRMAGLSEMASSASGLRSGLYSADATAHLYGRLAGCARNALSGGLSVIVDATFLMRRDRAALAAVARECHVPVTLIDCGAPEAVLHARIQSRAEEGKDASEANLSVLRWQQENAEPLGPDENLLVIDADTTRGKLTEELLAALRTTR